MGFNSFARVVLVAAAFAVAGSQASAQNPGVELQKGTNRSDYGAWSMICETPAALLPPNNARSPSLPSPTTGRKWALPSAC